MSRRLVPQVVRDATRLLRHYSLQELMGGSVFFSQFGEDLVLLGHFFRGQKTGFYVDVGAHDPVRYSSTRLFYRQGWRGINIEPIPAAFHKFEKYRPRDINLNLAVSATEGEADFTIDAVFSRIQGTIHAHRDNEPGIRHIRVPTRPLRNILDQHLPPQTRIDFLNIDCEGHDRIVLESNDWERYRPRVVLVEDLGEDGGLDEFLQQRNYAFLLHMECTKIFFDRNTPPASRSDG